ncbi:MAG: hypothetical protein HY367_01095 [Candidatus Aenigmarchaeota archaeon]|nr:hypothetical protein [Candidatus Aenigmarchaeota archaeon]
MSEGPVSWMLWTIAAIVIGLLIFVFFITTVVLFIAPACWKNTVSEIETLTGGRTLAKGLLGQPDFTQSITLAGSCVNEVALGGVDECINACGDPGFRGSEEKCLQQCAKCERTNGCIAATPNLGGFWSKIGDNSLSYTEAIKLGLADIEPVVAASNYQFSYQGPPLRGKKDEVQEICLHFTKAENSNVYKVESAGTELCSGGGQ